jgi:hypothetical protein
MVRSPRHERVRHSLHREHRATAPPSAGREWAPAIAGGQLTEAIARASPVRLS